MQQAETQSQGGAYVSNRVSEAFSPRETDTVKFISRYLSFSDIPVYYGKERDQAIQAWLLEYHAPETSPPRKFRCRDCILLNVYFLLPYLLRRHYALRASLFEDALQNMVVSVLTAIEKFDVTRGSKFTSYIAWYLKEAIETSRMNDGVVKIPRHARRELAEALAQPLTEDDFKEEAGAPEESKGEEGTEPGVDTSQQFSQDTYPAGRTLSWAMNANEADTLEWEYLLSEDSPALEEIVDQRRVIQMLEFLLNPGCSVLSEKEKVVITYRFGVFGTPKLTLSQVSDLFRSFGWKGTTEWIFQLQRKALEKVRVFFQRAGVESPFI
ncbi:MAG: hypothetical protein LHW56_01800 [Candidatus Cloacimonetes bacterium]|nr:hypothetical protein [Candidatus Cloacimonadota bacterium]MDY0171621.1 sigma factor [Candidatus Cloacimonadaceae bacterium]